jgi:hypothetical protein
MINKMEIDKKILQEIQRYHKINKYILEQDATLPPPPPPMDDPNAAPIPNAPLTPPGEVSPIPPGGAEDALSTANPQPIDVETDEDVTVIDDEGDSEEKGDEVDSEELDITDLVTSQKNIESKQTEYFDNLFSQITKLEEKLAQMDSIFEKLNAIDSKVEKYREKTPEEKLELRTYDSYPFNQKLSQFFDDKQVEMEKSGKNDYVLTSDDVVNINPNEIKNSFGSMDDEEDDFMSDNNYNFRR